MNVLRGLAVLLVFQAIGETLAHALALPFPGPVIGMLLLIPALRVPRLCEPVKSAAEALLGHLSLLFIPVGVGVITHLDMISNYGARLLVVIVVSTWMGMAVTAVLLNILLRKATFSGTSE